MNLDITPDPSEIVQAEEAPYNTVPVPTTICGPVETRELPASGYPGYNTVTAIGTAVAVRLLPLEPRRKYAVISADTQDIWIGATQAAAQSGSAGAIRVPAALPRTIGHVHELWACAVAGTTDVGVETVNWSQ